MFDVILISREFVYLNCSVSLINVFKADICSITEIN